MNREQHEVFRRGLEEFNTERFFEAHEVWEEVWLGSAEPEKRFLQGIIQIAAAFHHYQRGNLLGTRSLLEAGLNRLRDFPADQGGISLDLLCVAAGEWATALHSGQDPGRAKFPKVQMAEGTPKEAKVAPRKK
jgi:predicted metal-dependent hydrolase